MVHAVLPFFSQTSVSPWLACIAICALKNKKTESECPQLSAVFYKITLYNAIQ
jgi:hypothetical protein